MVAKSKSKEIRLTRIYDAPVKAVWDAWTVDAQVAQWWGPRGFTITTHSKDFKTGGHWKYTMHGPDGKDYPNTTKYLEVEKHKKMVYDHGGNEDAPPLFRVTVEFIPDRGKTRLEFCMALASVEAAENTREFIKKAGGNSTWDRLAEYLQEHGSGKILFVHNRSFAAPQAVLFQMWTDPKHLAQWVPPTGFTMQYQAADIRPGGQARYSMSGAGFTMYGRAEYLEIRSPDRIVYTQSFCDEQGNLSRHPKMPTFPATMRTTVELSPEGPDDTRVTITWEPQDATAEEIAAFAQIRAGMTQGWTGSLDKLEALLEKH